MKEIEKIKKLYDLKHVLRGIHIHGRKESSAEHSRSALILADYFINVMKLHIDTLKVYELLMYHDVVEIETGDTPINHVEEREKMKKQEMAAMEKIIGEIPDVLKDKFRQLFLEFEAQETLESRFAQAIDKLDADLYAMEHPIDEWGEWTEELVRGLKQKYYIEFPEMNDMFEKLIVFYKEK